MDRRKIRGVILRELMLWKETNGLSRDMSPLRIKFRRISRKSRLRDALFADFGYGKWEMIESGKNLGELLENYLHTVRRWTNKDIRTMEELDLWLASQGK